VDKAIAISPEALYVKAKHIIAHKLNKE